MAWHVRLEGKLKTFLDPWLGLAWVTGMALLDVVRGGVERLERSGDLSTERMSQHI